MDERSALTQAIQGYCRVHARAVLFDEPGKTLMDVAAGRTVSFDPAHVERWEERKDRVTGAPYLVLLRDDGVQLVLSGQGVAFEPMREHAPQVDLPPVVCLSDFRQLADRLAHVLHDHPDEPLAREAVELALVAVSVLGGARRVGFEVGREERELEALVQELEKRGSP